MLNEMLNGMQMRIFQCNTVRHQTCVKALSNAPRQEGRGFPLWQSKPELYGITDLRHVFLVESSWGMALPLGRTESLSFIVSLVHSTVTALSGLFLSFSCHSFPLEDSHSTPVPPQIAGFVVITLLPDLFIVVQPGRLVVQVGGGYSRIETM